MKNEIEWKNIYVSSLQSPKFIGKTAIPPAKAGSYDYILHKKEYKLLNKDYEPCDETQTLVSWKQCLLEYFDQHAGCKKPWNYHPTLR